MLPELSGTAFSMAGAMDLPKYCLYMNWFITGEAALYTVYSVYMLITLLYYTNTIYCISANCISLAGYLYSAQWR